MGADDIAMRATLDAGPFGESIDAMISKAEMLGQKMTGSMSGIGGKINDLGQAAGLNEGRIGSMGAAVGLSGTAFTAAAIGITTMAAGLNASVQSAASYQSQMNQVAATTGQTTDGMDALNRMMGRETTFSMSESARAMGMLADEGARTQDMASMLPATLKLAEAAHMDMGSAVKTLDNSLDQFHMGAEKSDSVVNELVEAAKKGQTSVGDLGSAMAMAGPTAASFGLSFTEVVASLSQMTGAGMSARQAGANLKGMLDALNTPSESLAEGLASIGLSTDDVSPKIHSFSSILDTLKTAGVDSQKAMDMFGTAAGPGMAALLDESKGSFEQYAKTLENTNAATEAAEKASKGYEGQMKKFGNAMDEAKVSLGTALLPPLTAVVGMMTDGINVANDFAGAIDKAMSGGRSAKEGSVKKWFQDTNDMMERFLGKEVEPSTSSTIDAWGKMYVDNFNVDGLGPKINAGLRSADAGGAGQDAGKAWVEAYGSALEAGMSFINGKWVSRDDTQTKGLLIGATTSRGVGLVADYTYRSQDNEYYLRTADGTVLAHGTARELGITGSDTRAGQMRVVDALIGQSGFNLSETERLELIGDTAGATKLKLTAPLEMETLFDLSQFQGDEGLKGYLGSLNKWFQNNPVDISRDSVKGLGDNLLNALGDDIKLSNLPIVDNSLNELFEKYNWSGTYGDLPKNITEKYKTSIKAGIVNAEGYAKNEMERFGQEISTAFEDKFLSPAEINLLKNLSPQLDLVKDVAVDEFFKGGGLAMEALVEGIKKGDMGAARTALADLSREAVKALYDPLAEPKNMGMVFDSFIGSTKDYPKFMEERLRQEHAVHEAFQQIKLMKSQVAAEEAKSEELIDKAIDNMDKDQSPVQLQIAGSEAEQFGKSLEKTQTILDMIQEKKLAVHADTSEIDKMSETLDKIKGQINDINNGPELEPGGENATDKKGAWGGFGSGGMADYGAGNEPGLPQAGEETYIKTGTWSGTNQYGEPAKGSAWEYIPSAIKWGHAPLGSPSGKAYTVGGDVPGGGRTLYAADDAAKIEALNSSIQGLPNSKQVNLHVVVDRVDFDAFISSLANLKPRVNVQVDVSANTAQIVSIVEAAVAEALDSIRA